MRTAELHEGRISDLLGGKVHRRSTQPGIPVLDFALARDKLLLYQL